jgi:hypothetical protein
MKWPNRPKLPTTPNQLTAHNIKVSSIVTIGKTRLAVAFVPSAIFCPRCHFVQRGSTFCFVVLVLLGESLVKILLFSPILFNFTMLLSRRSPANLFNRPEAGSILLALKTGAAGSLLHSGYSHFGILQLTSFITGRYGRRIVSFTGRRGGRCNTYGSVVRTTTRTVVRTPTRTVVRTSTANYV